MIFLVVMMILGGSAPVDYWMIRPTIVYDDHIDGADEWLGLFDMACSWMLRPVEVQFTLEDIVVCEGERPAGLIVDLPGSKRAATENIEVILPALKHGLLKLRGDTSDCAPPSA